MLIELVTINVIYNFVVYSLNIAVLALFVSGNSGLEQKKDEKKF